MDTILNYSVVTTGLLFGVIVLAIAALWVYWSKFFYSFQHILLVARPNSPDCDGLLFCVIWSMGFFFMAVNAMQPRFFA